MAFLTECRQPNDVVEEWAAAEHIPTCGIDANNESAGVDVDHGEEAHEQHQLVAGLPAVLLARKNAQTWQIEDLGGEKNSLNPLLIMKLIKFGYLKNHVKD